MKEKRMDANFRHRLQRRFHYGDMANLDVPSLPLTELAVDYFHDSIPEKLGHVDLYSASNVIRRNKVSPCSVVLSMMYAKRLRNQEQRNKEMLHTMSSADVFFISMMMASKYLCDEGVEEEVFNDIWAENTDQDVDDVNQMEVDFLQAMDWRLFVRPQEFEDTLAAVERRLALQQGFKRGWYTYTEMDILMGSDLMWSLWSNVGWECSKLLTAISAAYVTSVLSLMGSTALAVQVSGHLSSAAVAILALQSTPLLHPVSTGINFPMPGLSVVSVSAPPSMSLDTLETRLSQMDRIGFSVREEPRVATRSRSPNWHVGPEDGLLSTHPSGLVETANGNDSLSTEDVDYDKREPPASDIKHNSRSAWFFDSLVSRVWAVICLRSNLAIFNWSVSSKPSSPKKPDTLGSATQENGLMDRLATKIRIRQKERRSQNEDSADRKLPSRQKAAAHKTCIRDPNAPTDQNLCTSQLTQGSMCWTDLWHLMPCCCTNDPASPRTPCQHSCQCLPNLPEKRNPLKPTSDHATAGSNHHSCKECKTETSSHTCRQHIFNYCSNVQLSEVTAHDCQVSQQLQTGLEIPKGFFTSFSHAILAT